MWSQQPPYSYCTASFTTCCSHRETVLSPCFPVKRMLGSTVAGQVLRTPSSKALVSESGSHYKPYNPPASARCTPPHTAGSYISLICSFSLPVTLSCHLSPFCFLVSVSSRVLVELLAPTWEGRICRNMGILALAVPCVCVWRVGGGGDSLSPSSHCL